MHTAFRRAWWSLTLSAGVSLAPAAYAQLLEGPARPHSQVETTGSRAVEVHVELAWLDDPTTFPCQIAAHSTAEGMELRGFVPTTAARDRAVRLARQICTMPVIDHLHVDAHVADNPGHCKAEVLQFSIADCLKSHFSGEVSAMKAICNDQGQITITGRISTLEAKLAVSQQLRRISGCTCVHNQLHAGDDVSAPPAHVAVSHPIDVPVKVAPAPKVAETPAKKADTTNTAATPAPAPTPTPTLGAGTVSQVPSPLPTPAPKVSTPSTSQATTYPPAASLPPISSFAVSNAATPDTPVKLATPTVPTSPPTFAVPPPPVAVMQPAPSSQTWKPAPAIASSSPWPVLSSPAAKSDPAVRTVAATSSDKLGEAYVTTGSISIGPGDAYVTTGVEIIADATPPAAKPSAPVPPATRLVPAAVKASIEKLCGPKIQNVQVQVEAGNKVAVEFTAPTEADGHLFFDRIQAMPELGPYEVNVKVTTAR